VDIRRVQVAAATHTSRRRPRAKELGVVERGAVGLGVLGEAALAGDGAVVEEVRDAGLAHPGVLAARPSPEVGGRVADGAVGVAVVVEVLQVEIMQVEILEVDAGVR